VNAEELGMLILVVLALGSLLFLIFRHGPWHPEQTDRGKSVWRKFGLGLVLMILFFATWIGQGHRRMADLHR
jgi:hypothetical protein